MIEQQEVRRSGRASSEGRAVGLGARKRRSPTQEAGSGERRAHGSHGSQSQPARFEHDAPCLAPMSRRSATSASTALGSNGDAAL